MSVRERSLLVQARIAEARARRSARPAGIALVYHRIDAQPGNRDVELAPAVGRAAFRAELAYLQRRYDVVAPSALRSATAARRRGDRLPVAITFDDDTHSHIDEALPALGSTGIVAAFFVAGWSLHGDNRPWWELLQLAVDHRRFEPGGLRRFGREVEELPPDERRSFEQRLAGLTDDLPQDKGLDRSELAVLAARHEVGFHTRAHARLPLLDDEQLARALTDGRDALAEAIGRPIESIAYPHGDADDRVADAVRTAGYTLGFAGRNRALTAADNVLLLPRLDPSHASLGIFALTLARASLSA